MDELITFGQCLHQAANTPELVAEFDRLQGTHLGSMGTRNPIDAMIDDATGRDRDAVLAFAAFVYEVVYLPLVAQGLAK